MKLILVYLSIGNIGLNPLNLGILHTFTIHDVLDVIG